MTTPEQGGHESKPQSTERLARVKRARQTLWEECKRLLDISEERKDVVRNDVREGSSPGIRYYILMTIATLVAALGLVTNSAAVIIGAMLISPLMTPMFGVALGLTRGNGALVRKGLFNLFAGVLLAIVAGFLVGKLPLHFSVTTEMLSRTQPTLLDLGVALLAGTAGCLAMVDERISPVLPGIAIATSLVPPLAASGLCFALGAYAGGMGAFLLFFANFLAIVFVSSILFVAAGFVSREEIGSAVDVVRRFAYAIVSLVVVAAVLTHALYGMVDRERTNDAIERIIMAETYSQPGTTLNYIRFKRKGDTIDVLATLRASKAFSPQRVEEIEKAISDELGLQARLVVRSQIVQDVSATGSTSAVVDEDLNGRFITDDLDPHVRRTQLAEQTIREILDGFPGIYLRDLDLIELDELPVLLLTVETTRSVTAEGVGKVEDRIRERLQDPEVRLVIRAEDLVGVTRKGRILYGAAHLAKQTPEESEAQERVERLIQDGLTGLPDLYAINVDAFQDGEVWRVRAEVVGPRFVKPEEIKEIEGNVGKEIGVDISLDTWCRTELVVNRDGYAPREGYTERTEEDHTKADASAVDLPED